jgi:hypothetical protein
MIKDFTDYVTQRAVLMDYMQVMIDRSDWHGVSDAANDLRVLEAEQKNRMSAENIQTSDINPAESLQAIDQEPLLEGWPLWSGLPQPEPIAYIDVETRNLSWAKPTRWETPTVVKMDKVPLYTAPPQRKWVELTNDEMCALESQYLVNSRIPVGCGLYFGKDIQAKLKEKNGF